MIENGPSSAYHQSRAPRPEAATRRSRESDACSRSSNSWDFLPTRQGSSKELCPLHARLGRSAQELTQHEFRQIRRARSGATPRSADRLQNEARRCGAVRPEPFADREGLRSCSLLFGNAAVGSAISSSNSSADDGCNGHSDPSNPGNHAHDDASKALVFARSLDFISLLTDRSQRQSRVSAQCQYSPADARGRSDSLTHDRVATDAALPRLHFTDFSASLVQRGLSPILRADSSREQALRWPRSRRFATERSSERNGVRPPISERPAQRELARRAERGGAPS